MTDLTWALSSCVLIGAVIAVRAAFGARMRPALRYALWGLVLLRLLIPVQLFTAPWGVSVELPERVTEQEISVLPTAQEPTLIPGEVETFDPVPETEPPVQAAEPAVPAERIEPAEAPAPKPVDDAFSGYGEAMPDGAETVRRTVSAAELLCAVWLAGAGVTAAVFFVSNLRFYVRLRRRRRPLETDCPLRVYSVENISSSCLFGNAIYVEAETAPDESRLRHVLAHELSHYRHGDRVWALLRCVALSLHWYNPLVWLAASLSRQDSELCADAGALRYLGENAREHYGATLIELSARRAPRASLLCAATTMSSDKRSLRERVTMIARRPRMTAAVVIAVLVLSTVAAGCAFAGTQTEAKAIEPENEPAAETAANAVSPTDPYLTFRSDEPFELSTENGKKNWDGVLEYSADAQIWREWDGAATLESAGNVLYLRGTGNTVITGSPIDLTEALRWSLTGWSLRGSRVSCIGNIENLLDYQTVAAGRHPVMAELCYYDMFSGCSSLISAPDLPATTLERSCYSNMFSGCTSLTSAPALPATTLADSCYSDMFRNCTALTSAPELPATTLERSCFSGMFAFCTSLTSAPVLPATTLACYCYSSMLYVCLLYVADFRTGASCDDAGERLL